MSDTFVRDRAQTLYTALALIGVLAVADLVLLRITTDFWQHPAVWSTKTGIAADEILNLSITSLLLLLPAIIASRMVRRSVASSMALVCVLPALVLLIGSWSFYLVFDRFIGVFAIQMLLQDGEQIWGYLPKMPSVVSPATLAAGAVTGIAITALALWPGRKMRQIRQGLALLTVVLIVSAVPATLLWNKPYEQQLTGAEAFDAKINRVQETEYDLLKAKAGPFSHFVRNFASHMTPATGFDANQIPASAMTERQPDSTATPPASLPQDFQPYNVVFLLVESMQAEMLAAYGNVDNVMPTVDALSKSAYVFDNMHAQSSHSNYADIAALSGQYPLRSMNIHFYPENPSYPRARPYDVLGPLGYASGIFSSGNEHWGLMANFFSSEYLDVHSHVGSATTERADLSRENTGLAVKVTEENRLRLEYEGFMYRSTGNHVERFDGQTIEMSLQWLDTLPAEQPFFAYFNLQASHFPFNAIPGGFEREFLLRTDAHAEAVKAGVTEAIPVDYIQDAYRDSLHYADHTIAALVDHLKVSGRHDRTLYVITADTSILLTDSFLGNGSDLFPGVLHIPAIITVPGLDRQQRVATLAGQIDIMPTVFGLLGVNDHPSSQGINLLRNDNQYVDRALYAVVQTPSAHQYAVLHDGWQLIHDYESGDSIIYPMITSNTPANTLPPAEQQRDLANRLQLWINTQLAYYSSDTLQRHFNPPRLDRLHPVTRSAEMDE